MKSYVTVISTDNYLNGVLLLNKSLIDVKAKYKLVCLVGKLVSNDIINKLEKNGISIINIKRSLDLPSSIECGNNSHKFNHWTYTFDKLFIFGITKYKKIVYLDSDMIVLKNIDELFDYDHMSAVIADKSYPGNQKWTKLNSGLMVVEPNDFLVDKLVAMIPIVSKKKEYFGDQDVIQEYYPNWDSNPHLCLSESYNVFHGHCDYYLKNKIINEIKVIHFVGKSKPWLCGKRMIILKVLHMIIKARFKDVHLFVMALKKLKELH